MIVLKGVNIPEKEKKIIDEIQYYEDRYFTFDEPVPFCGLFIYPVTVRNYATFLSVSECLRLNKNETPQGVRMSHLDFLLSKITDKENGRTWTAKFSKLLELIFHIENGLKCNKCGKFITFGEFLSCQKNISTNKIDFSCDCGGEFEEMIKYKTDEKTKRKKLIIDGKEINTNDFNLLRKVPLYQNLPDYFDDSWVHPELRKDQEKKQELLAKKNGDTYASLERKIVCITAKSNYTINEIYNMTMRKFIMLLSVIDDAMTYETSMLGLMTGMVSSKKPIEHWVYKHKQGAYDSYVSQDDYVGTINKVNKN